MVVHNANQCLLVEQPCAVGLEEIHAVVVTAGQGLGDGDGGDHPLVQGVDDGAVQALGDGPGHESIGSR